MTRPEKIESLTKRAAELRKELREVEKEVSHEERAQHVDALKAHIGGTVKLGTLISFGSVNDKEPRRRTGTLLEVRRKYALVDFGGADGKWCIAFAYLDIVQPAAEAVAS